MQDNIELSADFWMACVECLEEDQNNDQNLKVGIEIDSISLIVNCEKHKRTIKIFKLAQEEADLFPPKCNDCS